MMLILDTRSNENPNMSQTFFVIIRNYKGNSMKLIQIDTMPAAFHSFSAQTRSNDCGEYNLTYFAIN